MVEKTKPQKTNEIPDMFKDSFFIAQKQTARKAFALPFALIVHVLIIAALIVIPLMSTGGLPQVEIYSAFLAPPPPPPPPPKRRPLRRPRHGSNRSRPNPTLSLADWLLP